MAFCGNCGNQLQGDEHFCVKCGKDTSAKPAATAATTLPTPPVAATAPVIPPAPPARPAAPPAMPMQPLAAAPGPYAAPGPVPIAVAVPQKHGGTTGLILLLVLIAGAGYYYYTHKTPATQAAPAKPAVDNASLVKQQAFDAHWDAINGFIQISNGKWTNNSQYPIQSATLECDQLDASGADLDQMRITLDGPVQPGGTDSFNNPFQMGAVANNLSRVTCTIVHVKQPSEQAQ